MTLDGHDLWRAGKVQEIKGVVKKTKGILGYRRALPPRYTGGGVE